MSNYVVLIFFGIDIAKSNVQTTDSTTQSGKNDAYKKFLEHVIRDGRVTRTEQELAEIQRNKLGISDDMHKLLLSELDWTVEPLLQYSMT